MKKRVLAVLLCLSMVGVPFAEAADLPGSTVQSYLKAIEAQAGANSYLVDLDGDGSQELLLVWRENYTSDYQAKAKYEVWSGSRKVASADFGPYFMAGSISTKNGGGRKYLVLTGTSADGDRLASYTLKNGSWAAEDNLCVSYDPQNDMEEYYVNGAASTWDDLSARMNSYKEVTALGTAPRLNEHSVYGDLVCSLDTSNSDFADVLSSLSGGEKTRLFNELLGPVLTVTDSYDPRTISDEDFVAMLEKMSLSSGFPFARHGGVKSSGLHTVFGKADFTAMTGSAFGRTIDYSKWTRTSLPNMNASEAYRSFLCQDRFYLMVPQMGYEAEDRFEALHLYSLGGGKYAAVLRHRQRLPEEAWEYVGVHWGVVRRNDDGSWGLLKLYGNAYVPTTAELNAFVQPSSWAKNEVEAAMAAGLVPALTGDPGYQDSITREQFAELALQLVKTVCGRGADMSNAKSFSDCTNPAVLEASAFGIVEGSGGNFNPKNTTDRQQIATMLGRSITALKDLTGKDAAPKAGSVDQFSDKAAIASWAKAGVGLLAANGILQGSGGRAMPTQPCTVEQSILMCYRIYQTFGLN